MAKRGTDRPKPGTKKKEKKSHGPFHSTPLSRPCLSGQAKFASHGFDATKTDKGLDRGAAKGF